MNKKHIFLKRLLVLLLAIVMLLPDTGCMALYIASEIADPEGTLFRDSGLGSAKTASASAATAQTAAPMPVPDASSVPESVPYSSLEYERPDTQALTDAIAALTARLDAGDTDAEGMVADYDAILTMFDHVDYEATLAYLKYAADVTASSYLDEYDAIVADELTADVALTDLSIRLYESPVTGSLMESSYTAEFKAQTYAGKTLNSAEAQPLFAEERTLTAAYDELLSTFTITDGGRTYSYDDLLGVADDDEYSRLVEKYYDELNAKAGALFTQLTGLRSRIAAALGYDSYTGYAYASYFRDYTAEDAAALAALVKKYIVPVYEDAVYAFYFSGGYDVTDNLTVDKGTFYTALRDTLAPVVPEAKQALDHMLLYGYCDDGSGSTRMESDFTTYLSGPSSPFLFAEWTGYATDAITVTHELGHFTRMYGTPVRSWSAAQSLDLDEVDSQGLELLLTRYYGSLFPSGADALEKYELIEVMYAILSGCMEDEFQQAVYADPDMTLEEMNALYARLTKEYGFADLFGYTGVEWCTISHTFDSPFYYVSYAVSMLCAAELWEISETDTGAAFTAYRGLLARPWDAKLRATCASAGLGDPFSEETVRSVAAALNDAF